MANKAKLEIQLPENKQIDVILSQLVRIEALASYVIKENAVLRVMFEAILKKEVEFDYKKYFADMEEEIYKDALNIVARIINDHS